MQTYMPSTARMAETQYCTIPWKFKIFHSWSLATINWMFPSPSCLNEATSFSQILNYLASSFLFLLTYISAYFYSSTFMQNLSSFEAHAIFLYYSSFFMCQWSNCYVSVSNLLFYGLLCDTGARPYINISLLPTGTMLGFVNRGHQRDTRRQ